MPTFSLTQKHAALAAQQARLIAQIAADTPDDTYLNRPTHGAPAGDERKLRGIPVVGARGVGGAIPGSRPGANLT